MPVTPMPSDLCTKCQHDAHGYRPCTINCWCTGADTRTTIRAQLTPTQIGRARFYGSQIGERTLGSTEVKTPVYDVVVSMALPTWQAYGRPKEILIDVTEEER